MILCANDDDDDDDDYDATVDDVSIHLQPSFSSGSAYYTFSFISSSVHRRWLNVTSLCRTSSSVENKLCDISCHMRLNVFNKY